MGPVLDLNLRLAGLFHAACEHGTEVLTLSREDGFVCEDLLAFHEEDHVGKGRIIDNFPHVLDQTIDSLIIDLVFLKLPDIKYAYVVEPLAAVESAEYEKLLCANDTCRVPLAACGGLL